MKTISILFSAITATFVIAAAYPRQTIGSPVVAVQEESEAKVRELQKQRIAILRDVAEQTAALYKNGRTTPEEAVEARLQAVVAEAEIERGAARVKLLEQGVETIKELEKLAQARFESARDTKSSVLKVKARRLETEIALERAKAAK